MLGLKLNHVSIRGPWSYWGHSTSEHWIPLTKGQWCRQCFQIMISTFRADSRFAPSQWETLLQNNTVSNWLGTNLESALYIGQLRAFITTHIIGFHESNNTELYYCWWNTFTSLRPCDKCINKLLNLIQNIGLNDTKPLSEPMINYYWPQISVKFAFKNINFHWRKLISKCPLPNGSHFVSNSMC